MAKTKIIQTLIGFMLLLVAALTAAMGILQRHDFSIFAWLVVLWAGAEGIILIRIGRTKSNFPRILSNWKNSINNKLATDFLPFRRSRRGQSSSLELQFSIRSYLNVKKIKRRSSMLSKYNGQKDLKLHPGDSSHNVAAPSQSDLDSTKKDDIHSEKATSTQREIAVVKTKESSGWQETSKSNQMDTNPPITYVCQNCGETYKEKLDNCARCGSTNIERSFG